MDPARRQDLEELAFEKTQPLRDLILGDAVVLKPGPERIAIARGPNTVKMFGRCVNNGAAPLPRRRVARRVL